MQFSEFEKWTLFLSHIELGFILGGIVISFFIKSYIPGGFNDQVQKAQRDAA